MPLSNLAFGNCPKVEAWTVAKEVRFHPNGLGVDGSCQGPQSIAESFRRLFEVPDSLILHEIYSTNRLP